MIWTIEVIWNGPPRLQKGNGRPTFAIICPTFFLTTAALPQLPARSRTPTSKYKYEEFKISSFNVIKFKYERLKW